MIGESNAVINNTTRFALIAAFVCMQTGCIVGSSTYLEPHAATGLVVPSRPACGGPPSAIRFQTETNGLVLVDISTRSDSNGSGATLNFSVGKNMPMPLFAGDEWHQKYTEAMDRKITIYSHENSAHLSWDGGGQELPFVLDELSLDIQHNKFVLVTHPVRLHWEIPPEALHGFKLQIPTLEIDGKDLLIPEITFTLQSGYNTYAINC